MCLVEGCVKFIVFGFNLVFVLVGAALIAVGVFFKLGLDNVTDAIPKDYHNIELAPTLTIVIGCVIFVIAFFGCCGALRSSSCLLTTYAVILLTIFILQIALGVFVFLEVNDEKDLRSNIDRSISDVFSKYDDRNQTRELVDFMQQELKCCGTTGPEFWTVIPKSCCPESNCARHFKEGCQKAFYDFILKTSKIIGITILALAATEVIGAILSLCLANSIRNEGRRGRYA